MTENIQTDSGSWRKWRIVMWSAAAILLLIPAVAMQFTAEVTWSVSDFVIFGTMLGVAGGLCELAARKSGTTAYRIAAALGVGAGFLLMWVNGAVGIIGSENDNANLMYGGVLLIAAVGAIVVRFDARGMVRAMGAAAAAQLLAGVIAVAAGWGSYTSNWPRDIIGVTIFFVLLWAGSAALFREAADRSRPA